MLTWQMIYVKSLSQVKTLLEHVVTSRS